MHRHRLSGLVAIAAFLLFFWASVGCGQSPNQPTTAAPRAKTVGDAVVWINFPPQKQSTDPTWGTFLTDIENHLPACYGSAYRSNDKTTWCHETTHGINAHIRNTLGAFPWGDLAKIDAQSPQRFAANFKTPTLISHGEKDFRVPVTQGLEYYNTLKQKGVPTRLIYFPDENHWILKPQNSILWHREVFAWLEKYIGKGPTK